MGNLVWHDWSRYVSLTASAYTAWAAFWGFLYRKFFWDFVGGTLRAPGGLQPADNVYGFIRVVVKAPVLQALSLVLALTIIALEYPAPVLKRTALYRSFAVRIVALVFQAFLAALYYQGTNGAIWSLIAILGYVRAISLRETMGGPTSSGGRGP